MILIFGLELPINMIIARSTGPLVMYCSTPTGVLPSSPLNHTDNRTNQESRIRTAYIWTIFTTISGMMITVITKGKGLSVKYRIMEI